MQHALLEKKSQELLPDHRLSGAEAWNTRLQSQKKHELWKKRNDIVGQLDLTMFGVMSLLSAVIGLAVDGVAGLLIIGLLGAFVSSAIVDICKHTGLLYRIADRKMAKKLEKPKDIPLFSVESQVKADKIVVWVSHRFLSEQKMRKTFSAADEQAALEYIVELKEICNMAQQRFEAYFAPKHQKTMQQDQEYKEIEQKALQKRLDDAAA